MYELHELESLSRDLLGFEPLNGGSGKGAVARALAERCVEQHAVQALLDAVAASRQKRLNVDAPPASVPSAPAPQQSSTLTIEAELGTGPSARVCRALGEEGELRLRLVQGPSRSDVQRYLVATRLVAGVAHAGLPTNVRAGAVLGDAIGVTHDFVPGELLRDELQRSGPRHFNEVLPLLWAIGEPIAALHEAGLCHGSLHLGNVLVVEGGSTPRVLLLDAGSHLLRPAIPCEEGTFERSWLSAIAPEQLERGKTDARSDVYAFGVLCYQLLTGNDPYSGKSAAEIVVSHLTETPEPLSFAAPRGVGPDIEAFIMGLLESKPDDRPQNGAELLEALRRVWRSSTRPPSWVSDERLEGRFAILAEDPHDQETAATLEASVDLGADPVRVAEGFCNVVAVVEERGAGGSGPALRNLLQRAARLYESAAAYEHAASLYERLSDDDPRDASSASALVRLLKRQRKFDEAVEFLLGRAERVSNGQRASCFSEIGALYEKELNDIEQASVAYVEAFVADPQSVEQARAVERVAGDSQKIWGDVLDNALGSVDEASPELRAPILLKISDWYSNRLGRSDLALPVLMNALSLDPGNDAILAGLTDLYRKGQHLAELGQILVHRADIAAPAQSRDLRSEAAEIAAKMGSPGHAEELFSAVLAEDPGHGRAAEGLAALLRARGESDKALKVLEGRALAMTGEAKISQCLQLGEAYELELDRMEPAERLYRAALAEDARHPEALKGLDRVLNRLGRYQELVGVLERELEVAVTARQRVGLYERLAGVYDEEFLDHEKAAAALEKVLELDPQRASAGTELARHYRRAERWSELLALYERQFAGSQDNTFRVEVGLALARLLDEQFGQPAMAVERLDTVLGLSPGHAAALAAMAGLRARLGDAQSALDAIDELAARAKTPTEEADQHLRAAALLDQAGDLPGTIDRLKRALDAQPDHPSAGKKLFAKYLESGNHAAAVTLLEDLLSQTKSDHMRARIAGQIAFVCHRFLLDDERAMRMAQLAIHLDATNLDALRVFGRIAYAEDRHAEAASRLETVVAQISALPADDVADTVFMYVDALALSGQKEKALLAIDANVERLVENADALLRATEISFEFGSPSRTLELVERLLADHGSLLGTSEEAQARCRCGECLLKLNRYGEALAELERAARLDPKWRKPLSVLADVHIARQDYSSALEVRHRELSLVEGEERATILLSMGEIAAEKLKDNDYAANCLLNALGERPDDRTILARLMQLYSNEKDWPSLIEVIERLARVVSEPKQRAKYLHTGALIASRELRDANRAAELLAAAVTADPSNEQALEEAIQFKRQQRDADGLKDLLKLKAANVAQRAGDRSALLPVLDELGATYEHLASYVQAARVYESALEIAPKDARFVERLARLQANNPEADLEQTTRAFARWHELEPYRPLPYQLLRKVYTESRRADGAWLVCQALEALGQAQPDESRFFARFREETPPQARRKLTAQEWAELVMPQDGDPLVTALLTQLQPYVLATRGAQPANFGVGRENLLDVTEYPHGLVYSLHYGSHVLPVSNPKVFNNPEWAGVTQLLPTTPPTVMLGAAAFGESMGPVEAAFWAGRDLCYLMPGLYLRQLLQNLTLLKAWMLAAVRLLKPRFPVAAELENSTEQALGVLRERATGEARDHLLHSVRKLLEDGASLDLKRWIAAVDLAADRSGLLLCHDLEIACNLIRAEGTQSGLADPVSRSRDLLIYSVSPEYFAARERLGVNIDAG
ncbi:MAG TPA: protein kinase [Polyangiaceae bacterium]|nr:protein kinase [Polyangiaceae bacterium]